MARCKLCGKRRMQKNLREGYCHKCIDMTAVPPGFEFIPKINPVLGAVVTMLFLVSLGYVLFRLIETAAIIWL